MKPEQQTQKKGLGGPVPDGVSVEAVRRQLEKILSSEEFAHSERLSRFLRFTVEQAILGHADQLKEYRLGLEVFDREPSYDPRTDPIVRVEAGRFRSKLQQYYQSRGRRDAVLIDFPKGSYVPVFRKHDEASPALARLRSWLPSFRDRRSLVVAAALLIAMAAGYWALAASRQSQDLKRQLEAARRDVPTPELATVWGPFLSSGVDTFLVFGSPLFFAGGEGNNLFLRFSPINDANRLLTDPNFQKLQQRFGPLSGPRYDYALMGDSIALQRLTAFFGRAGRKLAAIPAHQAAWESIREGNIIFLGAPRMNPLLKSLPGSRDFEWDSDQNIVNRNPQPGEERLYTTPSHRDEMTYAVVACLPGLRPDREVLLLTAHSAPGTLAAVEHLTRPDSARAMIAKLGISETGERKHYEMVLRVFVDHGAPVKSEYVTHHVIPPAGR